jgi:hypothetical protein
MTNAAKKERNRAYYLKNREAILAKARERNSRRSGKRLSLVPDPENSQKASVKQEPNLVESEVAQSQCPDFAAAVPDEQAERGESTTTNSDDSTVKAPPMTSHPLEFQMTNYADVIWLVKPAKEESCSFSSTEVPETSKPALSANEKSEACELGESGLAWQFWVPFSLRLLLVVSINLLLVFMQVEFYKKHDILPQFAWPMAIVSEIAFLSLVSMRFKNRMDWVRVGAFSLFFLYFVGALSFHVLTESRSQLETSLKNSTALDKGLFTEELKSARESLKIAEQGRSWKNMAIFGEQITKLQDLMTERPQEQVLGFSVEGIVWIQTFLLVLMRALLMATESLNAIRLREQFNSLFCIGFTVALEV